MSLIQVFIKVMNVANGGIYLSLVITIGGLWKSTIKIVSSRIYKVVMVKFKNS